MSPPGIPLRLTTLVLPLAMLSLCLSNPALSLAGGGKDKMNYGEALIVNLPLPEAEVAQAVTDVAQNGVIRGTKEYNKDEFVSGAKAEDSSKVFPEWTEGGKVFYKVRLHALDPRNFKDGGDVGSLVVRYVVQPQGEKNTVLRIEALFEEDFRHTVHPSNGSVETSEYKDIREHLDTVELMKKQNLEAEQEREEHLAKKQRLAMPGTAAADPVSTQANTMPPPPEALVDSSSRAESQDFREQAGPTPAPSQTLEERVKELRKQVERVVKAPGAALKSAPFHTASTLQLLTPGTEVMILINTPYWYGVETHEGQHGWMQRDQLDLP